MAEDKHVRKPNAIIQAGQNLSATQQNILYSMLRRFSYLAGSEDKDELSDVTYKIPIREAVPNFDSIKGGRAYELVRNHASSMVKQLLTRKDGKTTEYFNLVSYAKVIEGGSDIYVRFNVDVIPFLISMVKDGYTKLIFKEVYGLKSAYAKRVYELITMNRKNPLVRRQGFFEISLEEFRFKLGVEEKMYPRWSDFKRRVVEPAVSEIEEKTTLRFVLDFTRVGRKITGLIFREIIVKSSKELLLEPAAEQVSLELVSNIDSSEDINPLLEGIQPNHRIQIQKEHTKAFIEHYHKKVVELQNKGRLKSTFANCLYSFLTKDVDQFYEREKLKKAQRDEEKRMKQLQLKAEELRLQKEAEAENGRKERFRNAEKMFNQLSIEDQKERIEAVKNENPILENMSDSFIRTQAIESYLN